MEDLEEDELEVEIRVISGGDDHDAKLELSADLTLLGWISNRDKAMQKLRSATEFLLSSVPLSALKSYDRDRKAVWPGDLKIEVDPKGKIHTSLTEDKLRDEQAKLLRELEEDDEEEDEEYGD